MAEERQKVEHETLAENHQREMDKVADGLLDFYSCFQLREEMESGYTGQITELQSQLDGEKLKNKGVSCYRTEKLLSGNGTSGGDPSPGKGDTGETNC